MPLIDPAIALPTRQEAFCRHYTVSGNAADAARQAGYSKRFARIAFNTTVQAQGPIAPGGCRHGVNGSRKLRIFGK